MHKAKGRVIGFTWGKGTKLGKIGTLILNYKGKRLELDGFKDKEREVIAISQDVLWTFVSSLAQESIPNEAITHQGELATSLWAPKQFPRGSIVAFKSYTRNISKTARYYRSRAE